MTEKGLALFFISAIAIAAILVAGCVQGTAGSPDQNAGSQVSSPAQPSPGTTGSQDQNAVAGTTGSSPAHVSGAPGAASQRRTGGQGFASNATRIAAAADKLGVTAQQLTDAMSTVNATTGRNANFIDAAQKLGVTEQQLRDAFGFSAGARPSGSPSYLPTNGV